MLNDVSCVTLDNTGRSNIRKFYPAAQLVINKEGQLEIQLRKNPSKFLNIIDWDKAGTPLE
jgi:hypothetical protein